MKTSEPSTWLLKLESELLRALPSESLAITEIGRAIRRKAALQSECERPLGRFLLVGQPDKVKQLAAELARFLFGRADNTLCLRMEDYSEKYKVQQLFGHTGGMAAPYIEEGDLTGPIWRRPETVVIFEEVQRVHLDAWNYLLPLLTDGVAIDGLGRRVSFKNSVFFLSTTIGWVAGSEVFGLDARRALEETFSAEVFHSVDAMLALGCKIFVV